MCCLFGLIDYRHTLTAALKSKIIGALALECEARGTDAAGIAYNSGGKLRIYKRPGPARKLKARIPEDAYAIMGHTRMTTQGSERFNYNNHPFIGRAGGTSFALAHNGVLYNDITLRKSLKLPNTKIQTDSYIAVQMLEKERSINFASLRYMAEQVNGSFAFTVLNDRNDFYFVKGDNPLCIFRYQKAGVLIYTSTREILERALRNIKIPMGRPEHLEILCGDIWKVDSNGNVTQGYFDVSSLYNHWYIPNHRFIPKSTCMVTSKPAAKDPYVEDLKALAGYFGYTPDDVDALLNEGFYPEELEEYFYCGVM